MLKNNILASNAVYVSTCHNEKQIKKYFKILDNIFCKIEKFEKGLNVDKYLHGPTCHSSFKRLN